MQFMGRSRAKGSFEIKPVNHIYICFKTATPTVLCHEDSAGSISPPSRLLFRVVKPASDDGRKGSQATAQLTVGKA